MSRSGCRGCRDRDPAGMTRPRRRAHEYRNGRRAPANIDTPIICRLPGLQPDDRPRYRRHAEQEEDGMRRGTPTSRRPRRRNSSDRAGARRGSFVDRALGRCRAHRALEEWRDEHEGGIHEERREPLLDRRPATMSIAPMSTRTGSDSAMRRRIGRRARTLRRAPRHRRSHTTPRRSASPTRVRRGTSRRRVRAA